MRKEPGLNSLSSMYVYSEPRWQFIAAKWKNCGRAVSSMYSVRCTVWSSKRCSSS